MMNYRETKIRDQSSHDNGTSRSKKTGNKSRTCGNFVRSKIRRYQNPIKDLLMMTTVLI